MLARQLKTFFDFAIDKTNKDLVQTQENMGLKKGGRSIEWQLAKRTTGEQVDKNGNVINKKLRSRAARKRRATGTTILPTTSRNSMKISATASRT